MNKDEALRLALEALETLMIERGSIYDKAITAIKEALSTKCVAQPEQALQALHDENKRLGLYEKGYADAMNWKVQNHLEHLPTAQSEQDNTYVYASSLATAIWQKHYMKDSPNWRPLDTTDGVLTQIDNMTCGLVKEKPAQPAVAEQHEQEPVAWEQFHEHMAGPFYKAPPQRTWVGLTPQERDEINEQVYGAVPHHVAFHHAIEAKLKKKNT